MSNATSTAQMFYSFYLPLLLAIALIVIVTIAIRLFGDDKNKKSNNGAGARGKVFPPLLADEIREAVKIKPESIGKVGEMIVKTALGKKYQLPNQYILSNVLIPTKDGGTTEIDVIAITSRGILIFECKNMAGNIYGDTKAKMWLQYIGKEINKFPNPFRQNYGHLKALGALLSTTYGDVPIYCFLAPTKRGKWHIRNLGETDYALGINITLKDFMHKTPVSESANSSARTLVELLKGLQASEFAMEMHKKYVTSKHHY